MSGDKPDGVIAGVSPMVLAACCGLHAGLPLVGGITLAGLSLVGVVHTPKERS